MEKRNNGLSIEEAFQALNDKSKVTEAAKDAPKFDRVEDEKVTDLKGQVRDALASLVPADGEDELDPHDVIDAVLAYFDNEDALDYIRSCICKDDDLKEGIFKNKNSDKDLAKRLKALTNDSSDDNISTASQSAGKGKFKVVNQYNMVVADDFVTETDAVNYVKEHGGYPKLKVVSK